MEVLANVDGISEVVETINDLKEIVNALCVDNDFTEECDGETITNYNEGCMCHYDIIGVQKLFLSVGKNRQVAFTPVDAMTFSEAACALGLELPQLRTEIHRVNSQ